MGFAYKVTKFRQTTSHSRCIEVQNFRIWETPPCQILYIMVGRESMEFTFQWWQIDYQHQYQSLKWVCVKCNTGSANQRWIFRKNKLVCTEMCQCSDCENEDNDFDAEWESDVDDNHGGNFLQKISNLQLKLSKVSYKSIFPLSDWVN